LGADLTISSINNLSYTYLELIDALRWRYATKKYNDKKVSDDKLERIITAINLSASSFGLQPYRLFVVDNALLRKELSIYSFNPQITEASHLLVFAAFNSINEESIDTYIKLVARERNMPVENLEVFRKKGLNGLLVKTDAQYFDWAAKQAYIALGTALIAAAVEKVDATPMEGFNAEKFDEKLGLKDKGLRSVVLISLGYRDEKNDFSAKLKKVRWPNDEFVKYI
jgi:nitroreductase